MAPFNQLDWSTVVCGCLDYSWGAILTSLTVYTNAPQIQAGYWIGGYRASGTTTTITDSTKEYATGLIQLNTTTGIYTSLDGPYEAVEEGSLSYVPVGDMGILVYIGGDVPSIKDGINATMTSVS